ncbi:hypothetical protein BAUCODRAFT_29558 [Baudoinia panamericana UAMH 10762]|uniref:Uncharacterized protein n=1 Tax=Baudoinia panamericana (strain UAMH 10762) TaxID=717646 RepID=M2NNQ4_BAUPA|nr:uncharacterized protein BAUCODRAFT_29558 [Baudoinia panamericana UAMH 10762]EMD01155.1 hypothetical protein BAUCODRAFT_29558 [Baudoinia panamericana UAMH 10762]
MASAGSAAMLFIMVNIQAVLLRLKCAIVQCETVGPVSLPHAINYVPTRMYKLTNAPTVLDTVTATSDLSRLPPSLHAVRLLLLALLLLLLTIGVLATAYRGIHRRYSGVAWALRTSLEQSQGHQRDNALLRTRIDVNASQLDLEKAAAEETMAEQSSRHEADMKALQWEIEQLRISAEDEKRAHQIALAAVTEQSSLDRITTEDLQRQVKQLKASIEVERGAHQNALTTVTEQSSLDKSTVQDLQVQAEQLKASIENEKQASFNEGLNKAKQRNGKKQQERMQAQRKQGAVAALVKIGYAEGSPNSMKIAEKVVQDYRDSFAARKSGTAGEEY